MLPQVLQLDFGMGPLREGGGMGEKRREIVYPNTTNKKWIVLYAVTDVGAEWLIVLILILAATFTFCMWSIKMAKGIIRPFHDIVATSYSSFLV